MTLRISSIADAGNIQKERLVLRAASDVDVGKYAVFCCTTAEDDNQVLSGDLPATYWFEDFSVKSGDFVVLYTKSGKPSEKVTESGKTSHFRYWHRPEPLWIARQEPVLAFASPWQRLKRST